MALRLADIPYYLNPTYQSDGRVKIDSPQQLCIYLIGPDTVEKVRKTLNFFATISKICLVRREKLHIDFSNLQNFTAAASVLLFSEITRAQLVTEIADVVTFTLPKTPDVLKLFRGFGLYKAIMPGGNRKLINLFDDDHPYQSGTDPNKFLISTILNLKNQGLELSNPETRIIHRGIQEAMLNVIHHAYEHETDVSSGIGSRWWQLSFCKHDSKSVAFIIYDKGISIPESIAGKLPVNITTDAEAIEFAFQKGVTRYTDKPTRGKGSEDIKDVTTVKDNSKLLVYSGNGMYYINRERGDTRKLSLPASINGTMIEWLIPYE
ncbi:hypothetical protein L5M43_06375 [Shewanella sp. SW36]|uniref:hypothetical protein n=1 Tax=unclassified Shewanella TaxID=196818 RepID=UPI0021D8BFC3|nr:MULTISPECIES: hypothetical protein [unclassified Shewanella]MCU7974904.1 hypothetical protein [Shewanella sp. SW36]MCU7990293.1 hypothetical protein [Shewanella sp. SW1]MCU8052751.1 hypothetical protein [Shewanella sp. SM43]